MTKDNKLKEELLQKIKNEYAVNIGYEDWVDYALSGTSNSYYSPNHVVNTVATLYANTLQEQVEQNLLSQLTVYKEVLDGIINMSHDRGISGCTYGDTDYDSESAAYGYNTCLDYIKQDVEKVLSKAKTLKE